MASKPPRNPNIGPMLASPRCGARTRLGTPCRAPAVKGKTRCRMLGGAAGWGAPRGNKNALKSGLYTREAIARRRKESPRLREIRRQFRAMGIKFPSGSDRESVGLTQSERRVSAPTVWRHP